MASKRASSKTPLTGEPGIHSMNLRTRLNGSSDHNIEEEENLDSSSINRNDNLSLRGGRGGGRGGRGGGRGGRGGTKNGVAICNDAHDDDQSNNDERNRAPNNGATNESEIENLNINDDGSFTVTQMLNMASKNQFPQRLLQFGSKKKLYTPVLHFFSHKCKFEEKPGKIKFKCKKDDCILHASLGKFEEKIIF